MCKVCFQVRSTHLGLQCANFLQRPGQQRCCDCLARKQLVQCALRLDQGLAQWHGLALHGGEEGLRLGLLLRRERQGSAELQNVRGAGVAVEFGGPRQAHALARQQVLNFVFRERLDRAFLLSRVGRKWGRCPHQGGAQAEGQNKAGKGGVVHGRLSVDVNRWVSVRGKLSRQALSYGYDFDHMTPSAPPLPAALHTLLPADLRAVAVAQTLKRGERLFVQGDTPARMFYVVGGEVVLQRLGIQGENVVLQRVRQGLVAEASLQSSSYHCDAVMTSAGELIALPIDVVRQALLEDSAFASRWITMLNQELKRLRTQCERLSLVGVKDRLLHLIETEGEGGSLRLQASVKSIAAEIGVTHEALYRTLAAMEKQGQLQRTDGQLRLGRMGQDR